MLYEIWKIGAIVISIIIAARLCFFALAAKGFVQHTKWTAKVFVKLAELRRDGIELFGKWHWVVTILLLALFFGLLIAFWPLTIIFMLSK
ncbi:hypothetical protein UGMREWDR_CDS0046 [Aeromonas phage GomatiRiver_11]|nr:hypothetical protein OBDJBBDK_00043 [Aeromonas phage AhFM11]WKW84213.1 hypothetical protein UGMREWDR_CDS0046 [Aeromonas phage GomatiRiver_11]